MKWLILFILLIPLVSASDVQFNFEYTGDDEVFLTHFGDDELFFIGDIREVGELVIIKEEIEIKKFDILERKNFLLFVILPFFVLGGLSVFFILKRKKQK